MVKLLSVVFRVSKTLNGIAAIGLTLMICTTVVDVFLRTVGHPIVGAYEIVGFICGPIVIGFAIPLSSWNRNHVTMDILLPRLSRIRRNMMQAITRIISILLFGVAGYNFLAIGEEFPHCPGSLANTAPALFLGSLRGRSLLLYRVCGSCLRHLENLAGGTMTETIAGVVALCVLLLLFATGIELGFAMAAVGFLGFSYLVSLHGAINLLGHDMWDMFASYGYTVFPLFILMGQVGFNAGIAVRLYDAGNKFLGHIPGGLAMATVAGAAAFKAICGSGTATSATFASVACPEMDRYGYDKQLSTGIVATVGTLGTLIPPAVFLIIFGILTEQSVGKLFLAGIIPGLIAAFFFILVIYGWVRLDPSLAPRVAKSTWKERRASLPEVLWVLVIFMLVVGGLMSGFFTPTEAGGIGTFAVIVLAILERNLSFKKYIRSLQEALGIACMLIMLLVGSSILGHFIAVTNIPQVAADWMVTLPVNRYFIMFLICLVYLLGGSFIDDLAFMVLATPIFYPTVLKLGFDPIWFGIVAAVTVMIGSVIPPVAMCVFVVHKITKVPIGVIYKGVCPFLISMVVVGILLFMFPQIALWLPSTLMK